MFCQSYCCLQFVRDNLLRQTLEVAFDHFLSNFEKNTTYFDKTLRLCYTSISTDSVDRICSRSSHKRPSRKVDLSNIPDRHYIAEANCIFLPCTPLWSKKMQMFETLILKLLEIESHVSERKIKLQKTIYF